MRLIDAMMEDCTILNKITAPDVEGGVSTTWVDGAPIKACIVCDNSMAARVADVEGMHSRYTITTYDTIKLAYNDYLRRESDKKTFRITSNGTDKVSPQVSTLNISQVTAEEWRLTE